MKKILPFLLLVIVVVLGFMALVLGSRRSESSVAVVDVQVDVDAIFARIKSAEACKEAIMMYGACTHFLSRIRHYPRAYEKKKKKQLMFDHVRVLDPGSDSD